MPVFGDLTDTDLNRIRLIIQEEIKKETTTINQKIDALDARIQNVEKDVAWIRGKLESVDKQFEGVDKQFERIGDQITHVTYLTYGLIALIVAAVAIPQIFITLRSAKDQSLERQIETLTQEVETLKQQRIVNP